VLTWGGSLAVAVDAGPVLDSGRLVDVRAAETGTLARQVPP
jgi:hypothetical protein